MYEFFKNFDEYLLYESMAPSHSHDPSYINNCDLGYQDFSGDINKLKEVCAKFKYLYFLLFYEDSSENSTDSLRAEYLNFWLNRQLKINEIPLIFASDFYSKVKSIDSLFDEKNKLSLKIYKINEDHFQYMTSLYDLYDNYNNIMSLMEGLEKDKTCSYYADEYIKLYEKIIHNCPPQSNNSFCSTLEVSKQKYEQIKDRGNFFICKIAELPALPSYRDNSLEIKTSENDVVHLRQETQDFVGDKDTRYLSSIFGFTGTILGILFTLLILYKFTPFGYRLRNLLKRNTVFHTNSQELEEISLNNSEFQENDHGGKIYNVRYNSILNS
ncbi:PIR Superfamily Protein [Plasmodium ovale wallikeri]|uniref:PIR Superfamily Protein n=1 Tax=Plasmodium ovale wallikeri TaxID=864142 RepID=A0A1A9AKB8_PLAOA|nr:PIR Superfamily Protein [Plasmodium ovale wallikeri]SBT59084.1 PIR Superfamily Protein [Plasmodium ovale wallikeri]